jgi:hypothetical protein
MGIFIQINNTLLNEQDKEQSTMILVHSERRTDAEPVKRGPVEVVVVLDVWELEELEAVLLPMAVLTSEAAGEESDVRKECVERVRRA